MHTLFQTLAKACIPCDANQKDRELPVVLDIHDRVVRIGDVVYRDDSDMFGIVAGIEPPRRDEDGKLRPARLDFRGVSLDGRLHASEFLDGSWVIRVANIDDEDFAARLESFMKSN